MIAVLLAGGKGTRLKPFSVAIPKPLMPLGDVPIIEVVIRQLAAAGARRIVLTLGHLAPLFKAIIGDGARYGVRIDSCIEQEPLGTAGPLRLVPDLDDEIIVMNGDLLTTIDFGALLARHRSFGAAATIAVTTRRVNIDYGVVHIKEGLLTEYDEKPELKYHVSMGINVLSRRAVASIPAGVKFDMPDLIRLLSSNGEKVACYETDCYWQDIGRFDDYQRASDDFDRDPARFLPAGR